MKGPPKWLTPDIPVMEWCRYKGEECVACPDFEVSDESGVVMEIYYCMTKALNGIVLRRVPFNPKHVKPSCILTSKAP